MGRFESLVTWALGRSPYERELIRTTNSSGERSNQRYDSRGRPKRPETRENEKTQIRAANEVVAVTGLIENHRQKDEDDIYERIQETATGMHLMTLGRVVLFPGVWGTMGLRRRMLLYTSYAHFGFREMLQYEKATLSITTRLFSGFPAIAAYHTLSYAAPFLEELIDEFFGLDEESDTAPVAGSWIRNVLQVTFGIGVTFALWNLDMFASLKQVGLIPASRHMPNLMSFIPFSSSSVLQIPKPFSLAGLLTSASPIFMIMSCKQLEVVLSHFVYGAIYRTLPRPVGESMFKDTGIQPTIGFDGPDRPIETIRHDVREDPETLRALEGRSEDGSATARENNEAQSAVPPSESDGEPIWEIAQTSFSLDVEATVNTSGGSDGQWVAELRRANGLMDKARKYRITGITMLPVILASEVLQDVVLAIILAPIEASTIRVISLAYLRSAGLSTVGIVDPWDHGTLGPVAGGLFGTYALQTIWVGSMWAAYTVAVQWWYVNQKSSRSDRIESVQD